MVSGYVFDYVTTRTTYTGQINSHDDVLANVALAGSGEVDPDKLCDAILGDHGITRADPPAGPEDGQTKP